MKYHLTRLGFEFMDEGSGGAKSLEKKLAKVNPDSREAGILRRRRELRGSIGGTTPSDDAPKRSSTAHDSSVRATRKEGQTRAALTAHVTRTDPKTTTRPEDTEVKQSVAKAAISRTNVPQTGMPRGKSSLGGRIRQGLRRFRMRLKK